MNRLLPLHFVLISLPLAVCLWVAEFNFELEGKLCSGNFPFLLLSQLTRHLRTYCRIRVAGVASQCTSHTCLSTLLSVIMSYTTNRRRFQLIVLRRRNFVQNFIFWYLLSKTVYFNQNIKWNYDRNDAGCIEYFSHLAHFQTIAQIYQYCPATSIRVTVSRIVYTHTHTQKRNKKHLIYHC